MTALARLAIDFGTSHTVAVLDTGTGIGQPLLFGDSPLLPSAVHASGPGQILTGRDAVRAARTALECFEPNPKRRVDDGSILLGSEEYPVTTLISAVLKTVATEARRVAGGHLHSVAMTHPANWGNTRLGILRQAAEEAGLGRVQLVPEPEAAAEFFTRSQRHARLPDTVVVYDFGGGTFDVCVLTVVKNEYQVRAQAGLDDVGGADLDAVLLDHMGQAASNVDARTWQRIVNPSDPGTRSAFRALYEDIKDAKEQLSRNSSGLVHIPMLDRDFPVTREEFDRVARPLIEQTVDLTARTLSRLGIPAGQPLSLYLVGGSSRVPLVSTLLHRNLGQAPVITGQPEQVVAQGALLRRIDTVSASPRELPIVTSAPRELPIVTSAPPAGKDRVGPIPAPVGQTPPKTSSLPVRPLAASNAVARQAPPTWKYSIPQPPAPSAQQPAARPRKSRKRGILTILVVLVALGAGGWYLWSPKNDSASPNDSADGAQDISSAGNVSDEPAPDSFDECVYFESMEKHTLVSASCDGGTASHGVTRSPDAECDAAVEEDYGSFGDRADVYCVTELFEIDTCLNEDFNTIPCADPESAPYVIKDGPLEEDRCSDNEFEDSVKLRETDDYFCLTENGG